MGQSRARVRRKQAGRRRDQARAGEGKAAEQVRQSGEQCGARARRGKVLRGRTVWLTRPLFCPSSPCHARLIDATPCPRPALPSLGFTPHCSPPCRFPPALVIACPLLAPTLTPPILFSNRPPLNRPPLALPGNTRLLCHRPFAPGPDPRSAWHPSHRPPCPRPFPFCPTHSQPN